MISYKIKTWRCSCGYAQDFEPTAEAMNLHFNQDKKFPLNDVQADECPSCALKGERGRGLPKETDPVKKSVHNHMEQSDLDEKITEAETEPFRKVKTGRVLKVAVKDHLLGDGVEAFAEVAEEREETQEERNERIEKLRAELKPSSHQKIVELRTLHEDRD